MTGYEIHMGLTRMVGEKMVGGNKDSCTWSICLEDGRKDGMERGDGRVFGSYLHGLFDNEKLTEALLQRLTEEKGLKYCPKPKWSVADYKEQQYDKLAKLVRQSLDMKRIYEILMEHQE